MATFSYKELAEDFGENTADGLRNVANAAANFACEIYQADPLGVTKADLPDPTGFGAALNGLWTRLCSPRNKLPPPPAPPFSGGQCPERYNVSGTWSSPSLPNQTFSFFGVLGPIQGITKKQVSAVAYGMGLQGAPDGVQNPTGYRSIVSGAKSEIQQATATILSVVPVDGSDQCGNPPPQYPVAPIVPPVYQDDRDVNFGNDYTITVPIVYVPVQIDADVDIYPEINVEVGPFEVNFNLDGIEINFGGQNPGPGPIVIPSPEKDPRPNPPTPTRPESPSCNLKPVLDAIEDVEEKVDELSPTLQDIKDCACPVSYTIGTQLLGSGEGGVVALPQHSTQVRLELTQEPINAKTQRGGGSAPTHYFCGYYSFGDGVGLGERIPINAAQSVFEVPQWATSFSWSLYAGYVANITAVYLVPAKVNAELSSRQMKVKPS